MFDPGPLINLAEELGSGAANGSLDEIKLRAAVGRLYYAVFLVARDKTGVFGREGVHSEVMYHVKRKKGTLVGERFNELKELREVADYEFPPMKPVLADWDRNWRRARLLTEHLMENLRIWR